VAQAMINMGCNNVIRMDGGGSSAMYVSNTGSGSAGYVQSSSRAISDCILVVSRASATNATVKSNLLSKINSAESYAATMPSTSLTTAINAAKAVYNSSTSVMGDHKRAIMELSEIATAKGVLQSALDSAAAVNVANYSDLALDRLAYAYKEASRLLAAGAADAELIAQTTKLKNLLADTTTKGNRLSLGASYATNPANSVYPDNGLAEMTNGLLFGKEPSSAEWTGYQLANAHGSIEGKGSYLDIKVDLGSKQTITGFGVSTLSQTSWGISAPTLVEVYASGDGINYYLHSTLTRTITPVSGVNQVIPYEAVSSTPASDRYVIFRVFYGSSHLFIGEVSVYGEGDIGRSDFTAFNKRIATDDTVIFTPALGTATHDNANLTWAHGYVCTYDSAKGAYVINSIVSPNGDSTFTCAVPSNGIIVGLHGASYNNNASAKAAKAGDLVYLTGIDITNGIAYPGARISFKSKGAAVSYTAPTVGVVKEGAALDGDYISIADTGLDAAALTELFVDQRVTVNGTGTGATVTFKATGKTYTLYVVGDINGDNVITAADIVTMKGAIKNTTTVEGAYKKAADLDNDGLVNTTDYVTIKRNIVNG